MKRGQSIQPHQNDGNGISSNTLNTGGGGSQGCGHFRTKPLKVAKVEMDGYEIGYEIHGNTENVDSAAVNGQQIIRVAMLMGFMNSMGGWDRVLDYFLPLNDGRAYQFLVLDNRGIGQSTQGSFSRMTTSSLAMDALAVLDHAGWTEERSINLIGISMGGMIALELAWLDTQRFRSLILLVTGSHWRPPRNNRSVVFSVLGGNRKNIDERIKSLMSIIFSDEEFLEAAPNPVKYPSFRTNREQIHAALKRRMETLKAPGIATFLGQLCALLTHRVSAERLAKIGSSIPDMLAVGALADKIVDPLLSVEIAKHSGCKLIEYKGKGHVITAEAEKEGLMEELKAIWLSAENRWNPSQ